MLSPSALHIGTGINDVGVLTTGFLRAYTVAKTVDREGAEAVAHTHIVVSPKSILEEGLVNINLLHTVGIDGIHEIAVVHHDASGLLREGVVGMVDSIDETRVGEVFDIIHDGGARGLDVLCKLADIGRRGTLDSEHIKQLLELGQVFEFYLLDEEDVDLDHHVHGLEKVLREVATLKEERIKAVVEVGLEEMERVDNIENLGSNALVVAHNLLEGEGREGIACLEVKELAERESSQVVAGNESSQFGVLLLQAHDAGACEYNTQTWVLIMTTAQLSAP